MPRQFVDYTPADLKLVGSSFIADFVQHRETLASERIDTKVWTNCFLDWFANSAPDNIRVDARPQLPLDRGTTRDTRATRALRKVAGRPRATSREFMFDLCHSTWPRDEVKDYWHVSLQSRPVLRLVLESEMGKERNPGANIDAVMEDAVKLLHVQADTKVVIVASNKEGNDREALLRLASQLHAADRTVPSPAWLWLDVPWSEWDSQPPASWLIHGPSSDPQPC